MASPAQANAFALQAGQAPLAMTTFAGYLVLAGLTNATIAAFLFCHLPASQIPTLTSLSVRALLYVAGAALAGAAGARFYWNRSATPFSTDPPLSFRLFALANAAGWVWVPSVVLLSRQDSPASSALAALGAALLATGLRRVIPSSDHARKRPGYSPESEQRELFAAPLATEPREAHGYVMALCLYAAGYFLINRYYLNAGAPLALCAFLFAWKLTLEPADAPDIRQNTQRAARRLAAVAVPAVLVTLFCLLYGVEHRNHVLATNLAMARGSGASSGNNTSQKPQNGVSATGISGYESVILWPVPEKKQIVPPLPTRTELLTPGTTKPLVIRFDGPYWYFQPPGKRPGPRAHQAQGSPLAANIEANNLIPLAMEAHQNLSTAVRLSRCREIQVAIENRDNHPGQIALAVLLTDSAAPGKPALYLGQQPIVSTQPAHFSIKPSPAAEVLRFTVPSHGKIREFDEITVLFLPDLEHWQLGAKIAIEQFELLPR